MSVYYDVSITMPETNWRELISIIDNADIDQWDKDVFHMATVDRVPVNETHFVVAFWRYVKWDVATNEMAEIVETYARELKRDCVPVRYICLSEFGTEDEIKCIGKGNSFIPFIESCMWTTKEIRINPYLIRQGDD